MKEEQKRARQLLIETVSILCRNSLKFSKSLKVEGVIGITLDEDNVFIVHLNEFIEDESQNKIKTLNSSEPCNSFQVEEETENDEISDGKNLEDANQPIISIREDASFDFISNPSQSFTNLLHTNNISNNQKNKKIDNKIYKKEQKIKKENGEEELTDHNSDILNPLKIEISQKDEEKEEEEERGVAMDHSNDNLNNTNSPSNTNNSNLSCHSNPNPIENYKSSTDWHQSFLNLTKNQRSFPMIHSLPINDLRDFPKNCKSSRNLNRNNHVTKDSPSINSTPWSPSVRFICEISDCGVSFSNKQNLLRHQTQKHGRLKITRRPRIII